MPQLFRFLTRGRPPSPPPPSPPFSLLPPSPLAISMSAAAKTAQGFNLRHSLPREIQSIPKIYKIRRRLLSLLSPGAKRADFARAFPHVTSKTSIRLSRCEVMPPPKVCSRNKRGIPAIHRIEKKATSQRECSRNVRADDAGYLSRKRSFDVYSSTLESDDRSGYYEIRSGEQRSS